MTKQKLKAYTLKSCLKNFHNFIILSHIKVPSYDYGTRFISFLYSLDRSEENLNVKPFLPQLRGNMNCDINQLLSILELNYGDQKSITIKLNTQFCGIDAFFLHLHHSSSQNWIFLTDICKVAKLNLIVIMRNNYFIFSSETRFRKRNDWRTNLVEDLKQFEAFMIIPNFGVTLDVNCCNTELLWPKVSFGIQFMKSLIIQRIIKWRI